VNPDEKRNVGKLERDGFSRAANKSPHAFPLCRRQTRCPIAIPAGSRPAKHPEITSLKKYLSRTLENPQHLACQIPKPFNPAVQHHPRTCQLGSICYLQRDRSPETRAFFWRKKIENDALFERFSANLFGLNICGS
jgi:hypothetical protein